MALEVGTYVSDLVATNPVSGDPVSQADDHLRLIKSTVKTTFPNVSGAVNPTHTQLNYVVGVTSAIQTQIDHATLTRASSTTAATKATIDFTSIPTWVKRVTVSFYGLKSAGGVSSLLIPLLQIGSSSGGLETTGYVGSGTDFGTTAGQTTGFAMCGNFGGSNTIYGRWQLENVTGNLWVCAAVGAYSFGPTLGAGGKTTSDVLDRVRITTVGGTELYTGGTVNISYE